MRAFRFPHPLVLLVACVALAASLSHLLLAGEYARRQDVSTGRQVVVAGSYHAVPAHPVGFFEAVVAIPEGMIDAGSVIFLVFLVGGAFSVVEQTGALKQGVEWLTGRFGGRAALIIPLVSVVFATAGALEGMWEEIVALMPVLLLLARRAGFDPLTAVAMSLGAAGIGSTFSPINPFSVGIAQRFAELPLLSGLGFRMLVLVPAIALWIGATMRHADRHRRPVPEADAPARVSLDAGHAVVLLTVLGAFAVYVYGTLRWDWGFNEMSALFFLMGAAAGLAGGLGVARTADAFVEGLRAMAYAAVLIGVARAIFIVLDRGKVVDTVIDAMVAPLSGQSPGVFAFGMTIVQTLVTFPVPSSSGRAVLTMPILVPLSDLLGVSRQVTVLAYQYGPGIVGQFMPTDGALMAVLAIAGVRYDRWLRFCAPICTLLFVLGVAAVAVAAAIGLR